MAPAHQILVALGLFALGAGAGWLYSAKPTVGPTGFFSDRALARAVIGAGAVELAQSDCALSTEPGQAPTVADFVLSYLDAAALGQEQAKLHFDCGARGTAQCSVSYSVILGEKADTNILLFSRANDGSLVTEGITCIAQ